MTQLRINDVYNYLLLHEKLIAWTRTVYAVLRVAQAASGIVTYFDSVRGSQLTERGESSPPTPQVRRFGGHQHGAWGHQVARKDHVGGPRASSKNSVNTTNVFAKMNNINYL